MVCVVEPCYQLYSRAYLVSHINIWTYLEAIPFHFSTNSCSTSFSMCATQTISSACPPLTQSHLANQINSILIIQPPSINWRGYSSINIIFFVKRAFNYAPVTFRGGTPHGTVKRERSFYTKIHYSTPFICVSRSARAVNSHFYLGSELKKLQPYHPFKFDVFTVRNTFLKGLYQVFVPSFALLIRQTKHCWIRIYLRPHRIHRNRAQCGEGTSEMAQNQGWAEHFNSSFETSQT